MNDLVEKLRSSERRCVNEDFAGLMREAADHIEAQNKLIEEVEGYLVRIAEMDEVDAALDPTHAIRIAGAARRLIRSKASKSNHNTPERNDK